MPATGLCVQPPILIFLTLQPEGFGGLLIPQEIKNAISSLMW